MEIIFKPSYLSPWTLTDKQIISDQGVVELSDINNIKHTPLKMFAQNGVIQLYLSNGGILTLGYPKNQKSQGEQAAQYI